MLLARREGSKQRSSTVDHSRRSFLYAASAWASLAFLSACTRENGSNTPRNDGNTPDHTGPDTEPGPATLDPTDNRGTLIGPGARPGRDGEMQYWLRLADLDTVETYVSGKDQPPYILIPFMGHAVIPHPVARTRAAVFAKWGPGGCEVDLKERALLRVIEHTPGREFYGHGAWSKDGQLLYAVESEPRETGTYAGYVVVRDADDMRVLGEFPTYGKSPHDCHILDDGKTLAITNGGGGPGSSDEGCVTFVDIQSEKLLERVTIPQLMAGHLAISGGSSKGDLAVGSTPHSPPGTGPEGFKSVPGGLTLRAAGGTAATLSDPAEVTSRMLGETLSLAIHEELNIVGATNPAGDICTFWDIKSGRHLKSIGMKEVCGIALTLDGRYFVLTGRHKFAVQMVRARDLAVVEEGSFNLSGINGSHCIIYDL
jgi:uncharacterized protein